MTHRPPGVAALAVVVLLAALAALAMPSGPAEAHVTGTPVTALALPASVEALGAPAGEPAHGQRAAAESSEDAGGHAFHFGVVFLMFAMLIAAAQIGSTVERLGQPAVIGQLLAGIVLSGVGYLGWGFIEEMRTNEAISFIAAFGVLLLLFSIGLESSLHEMRRVGLNALLVALIGVALPFALGTFLVPYLFYPEAGTATRLFIGASLVATSVGITASVFRSLGVIKTRAAQTVVGAAVIDDVLGLIVLALVSAIASGGSADAWTIVRLSLISFGFLGGAILLGSLTAGPVTRLLSWIDPGVGMKLAFAVGSALWFGFLADLVGLEPIIGAFAAGLLLEKVHFSAFSEPRIVSDLSELRFGHGSDRDRLVAVLTRHRETHAEDLVNAVGLVFIPIFFVFTGMQIDFAALLRPDLYLIAGAISVLAIVGKVAAGIASRGSVGERVFVGVAMMPRGEVGLIFAATGRALGVLSAELFSVIVLVVVITTFAAPPLLKRLAPLLPDGAQGEAGARSERLAGRAASAGNTG
jgi:Kef-type K+ transport system membrane component KefB